MSHRIGSNQQGNRLSSRLSRVHRDKSKLEDHKSRSDTPLSDADREFLFNQLLEGIAHGWHERRIVKFFRQLDERTKQEDWSVWLERLRPKLLKLPLQSQQRLGTLMMRLGELTKSTAEIAPLGIAAYSLGRELLLGKATTVVWEYIGSDLDARATEQKSESQAETKVKSLEQRSSELASEKYSSAREIESDYPSIESLAIKDSASSLLDSAIESLTDTVHTSNPKAEADPFDEPLDNTRQIEESSERVDIQAEQQNTDPREKLEHFQQPLPLAATPKELWEITAANEKKDPEPFWDDEPSAVEMQQVEREEATEPEPNPGVSPRPNFFPSSKPEGVIAPSQSDESIELIESWFNLGLKQVSAGDLEQAIVAWEKALNINPNLSEAWHNRGSALGRLGHYEAAIDSFQNALSIDPNNYQAWNDRAHALYQLEQWSEAVDSWSNALKIVPGNHLFWYNRGCALEQLEQWSEAIASYEKALEIKPDFQPGRSRYINLVADTSRSN